VWPAIADALGMEPGGHEPLALADYMPQQAALWDRIRAKHGLTSPGLAEFVGLSFQYADYTMGYGRIEPGRPGLVSTIKIQQAGFHEVMDTEAMFRKWFAAFQREALLPPK
jgi:hypothetical protein